MQLLKGSLSGIATGAGTGAVTGGTLLGAPILGGVGVVIISGAVCPPWLLFLVAIGGGALIFGSIGFIVAKIINQYRKHRTRALQYLEWLSKLAILLEKDIRSFRDVADNIEKYSSSLWAQLDAVKRSLTSEKQRQKNRTICEKAKTSLENVCNSLQEVMQFDVNKWTDPKHLPTENFLALNDSASVSCN